MRDKFFILKCKFVPYATISVFYHKTLARSIGLNHPTTTCFAVAHLRAVFFCLSGSYYAAFDMSLSVKSHFHRSTGQRLGEQQLSLRLGRISDTSKVMFYSLFGHFLTNLADPRYFWQTSDAKPLIITCYISRRLFRRFALLLHVLNV